MAEWTQNIVERYKKAQKDIGKVKEKPRPHDTLFDEGVSGEGLASSRFKAEQLWKRSLPGYSPVAKDLATENVFKAMSSPEGVSTQDFMNAGLTQVQQPAEQFVGANGEQRIRFKGYQKPNYQDVLDKIIYGGEIPIEGGGTVKNPFVSFRRDIPRTTGEMVNTVGYAALMASMFGRPNAITMLGSGILTGEQGKQLVENWQTSKPYEKVLGGLFTGVGALGTAGIAKGLVGNPQVRQSVRQVGKAVEMGVSAPAMMTIGSPAKIAKQLPVKAENALYQSLKEQAGKAGLDLEAVQGIREGEYWVSLTPKKGETASDALFEHVKTLPSEGQTRENFIKRFSKSFGYHQGQFVPFKSLEDAKKFIETGDTSTIAKSINLKGSPITKASQRESEKWLDTLSDRESKAKQIESQISEIKAQQDKLHENLSYGTPAYKKVINGAKYKKLDEQIQSLNNQAMDVRLGWNQKPLKATKSTPKPIEPLPETPIKPIEQVTPTEVATGTTPPPIKPPVATAQNAPKPNENFAGNIRLSKYPEEIRQTLKDWADANPEVVAEARRGTRSDKQVLQDAEALVNDVGGDFSKLIKRWKPGQAWNDAEILAFRSILRQKTEAILAAQKAVLQSNSTENLLKLRLAIEEQGNIQKAVTGVTSESGRSLRQFRQDVFQASQNKDAAMLERLLKKYGGRDNAEEIARALANLDVENPASFNNFIRNLQKPGLADKVREIYINSLLAGIKTHVVNGTSNTVNAIMSPVERGASALVETGLAPIQRRARERFFSEVPADAWGAVQGIRDGARAYAQTMKTGVSPLEASKWELQHTRVIGGKLGRVVNLPTTEMEAADNFLYQVNYRAAYDATAKRMVSRSGKRGQEAIDAYAELISNPTKGLMDEAQRIAEERLYRAEAGKFTQSLMNAREAVDIHGFKPLGYIFPFIRTSSNLLKYGLERSPAGFMNPKLWANLRAKNPQAADQLARATLGTLGTIAIALYFRDGRITGAAPSNVAERERFYADGKQPFSVRIGDTWMSYQRIEPFNQIFAQVAALMDAANSNDKDLLGKVGQTVNTIGQNFVSQSYMSGIANVINALEQPEQYAGRTLENIAVGLIVPASAMTRTIAQGIDTTIRQPRTFIENLKTQIPGLSKDVPPKIDIFGQEVTRKTPVISPINISPSVETPLTKELNRLKINIGLVSDSISGVPLTNDERRNYQVIAGQLMKTQLEKLVTSDYYKRLSDEQKEKAIESVKNDTRDAARTQILKQIPVADQLQRKKMGKAPGAAETPQAKAANPTNPTPNPTPTPTPSGTRKHDTLFGD